MSSATRLLGKLARSLLAWAERSADPAEREWVRAMRAELDLISGGLAQLSWAVGALPLLWRAYRVDILRCMVCVTAVVAANYAYPWLATAGPMAPLRAEHVLFFFAQQFYLPVVGILAAQATHRLLAGTLIGIALSLLGFAVLHAHVDGPSASASIYPQILFFALIGAAFGTLGATAGLWTSRQTATT
jgi:hypothetical protein